MFSSESPFFFWKILPRKLQACSPVHAATDGVSQAGLPSGARGRSEGLTVRFGGHVSHCHLPASRFVSMTPAHSHSTGTVKRLKKKSVCQGETDTSLLCALGAATLTAPCAPGCTENARASGGATTGGLAHRDLLPAPPKPRNLGSGQK